MEASFEREPDVFISFRGEDCRSGFKSHLYTALCQKKIDAYVDDELRKGDEISTALLTAIEKSKISVIIFTQNYACSRWCLDELVKIMKCKMNGQIVVPVFYKIDPSDIRHQKRKYADAFDTHKNRYEMEKLEKWRKALQEAANLSGWNSSAFSNESDFIDTIVKDLLQKLSNNSSSDDYTKGLVGMDEHIEKVESLLFSNEKLSSSEVKTIGLWGMGGVGKTTIATALYEKLSSKYEDSCFMENVREEWEKAGRNHVRTKFLSQLLKEENPQYFASPRIMRSSFTHKRLQRKKVLIVLDDLNDLEQLDCIVGGKENYGPGTRIIVTTRDKSVINKCDAIYKVHGMDNNKALQLFSLFAFEQRSPPTDYTDLSQRVVRFVVGNPLALKVYGSSLYKKNKREWESACQKLLKIPDKKVMEVLRLSYESLDDHDKNVFLDIACFFKRESKYRIITVLDGCGLSTEIALSRLEDKCLITTSSSGEILMHDLIQEMAQEVVRENCERVVSKYNRLWDSKDIYKVLEGKLDSEAVKGIFLDMSTIKEVCLNPDIFKKMDKLKFLIFRAFENSKKYPQCSVKLSGDLLSFPEELRILHWEGYPLKSLPSEFCQEKLVELNLSYSRIEKLWDGVVSLPNLKSIDLSFCQNLTEIPNLSQALSLEIINVACSMRLCYVHKAVDQMRLWFEAVSEYQFVKEGFDRFGKTLLPYLPEDACVIPTLICRERYAVATAKPRPVRYVSLIGTLTYLERCSSEVNREFIFNGETLLRVFLHGHEDLLYMAVVSDDFLQEILNNHLFVQYGRENFVQVILQDHLLFHKYGHLLTDRYGLKNCRKVLLFYDFIFRIFSMDSKSFLQSFERCLPFSSRYIEDYLNLKLFD